MKRKRYLMMDTKDYQTSEYFHITAFPAKLPEEEMDEQDRSYIDRYPHTFNSGSWCDEEQGDHLADLQIDVMAAKTDPHNLYSWTTTYRSVFEIDKYCARAMAKTLNKVDRKLESFAKKWGVGSTFADYLKRVCYALNIQGIIIDVSDTITQYIIYKVEDADAAVNYLTYCEARKNRHLIEAARAAASEEE